MIFGFVAKHRVIWPVSWMCETLGVRKKLWYQMTWDVRLREECQ